MVLPSFCADRTGLHVNVINCHRTGRTRAMTITEGDRLLEDNHDHFG
jgi:hypothetical protein